MTTLLLAILVMLAITALMSIGVWLGRRPPLRGSCGGLPAALKDPDHRCPLCGKDAKTLQQTPCPNPPEPPT